MTSKQQRARVIEDPQTLRKFMEGYCTRLKCKPISDDSVPSAMRFRLFRFHKRISRKYLIYTATNDNPESAFIWVMHQPLKLLLWDPYYLTAWLTIIHGVPRENVIILLKTVRRYVTLAAILCAVEREAGVKDNIATASYHRLRIYRKHQLRKLRKTYAGLLKFVDSWKQED
jgi:hypothetical protein